MKRVLVSIIMLILVVLPLTASAYSSSICGTNGKPPGPANICTAEQVGPFMQGISVECGNTGTCTLDDIMLVVANAGNWIVGIVGAVVLLMYTIGGIYLLTSSGNSSQLQKGKDYMKVSTIGLLIVFFAYLGIMALKKVLETGSF